MNQPDGFEIVFSYFENTQDSLDFEDRLSYNNKGRPG